MTVRRGRFHLFLVFVFALAIGCADMDEGQTDLIAEEETNSGTDSTPAFNPVAVVRPFPAIIDAPVITAEEVSDQVVDAELVLGVVVNGEARAYPINMLTGPSREIINDTLGNRAIAATW